MALRECANRRRTRPVQLLVGHAGVDGGKLALRLFADRLRVLRLGLSAGEIRDVGAFLAADARTHRNAKAVDIASLCRQVDEFHRFRQQSSSRPRNGPGVR